MSPDSSTMLVLASGSQTRKTLMVNAGLSPTLCPAALDEAAMRVEWSREGRAPSQQAVGLAEAKAMAISPTHAQTVIVGADQVLEHQGQSFGKARSRQEAAQRLAQLQGTTHQLHTAVTVLKPGQPSWSHLETAHLTMRPLTEAEIAQYLDRAWPHVSGSSGAYHVEGLGLRLFTRIEGDWTGILGLPMLPLLCFLNEKGVIPL